MKFFFLVIMAFFLSSCGKSIQQDAIKNPKLLYLFHERKDCPYLFSPPHGIKIFVHNDLCQDSGRPFEKTTLILKIDGLRPYKKATVNIFIFSEKDTWLSVDEATLRVVFPHDVENTLTIKNLPAGFYAVGVFQDRNNNGTLDVHWFPIPFLEEGIGSSGSFLGGFTGPPSYDDASFYVGKTKQIITIKMVYYD